MQAGNTLFLLLKILHKHCFQFLLGHTVVPREIENNAYKTLLVVFGGGGGVGRQTKCIISGADPGFYKRGFD